MNMREPKKHIKLQIPYSMWEDICREARRQKRASHEMCRKWIFDRLCEEREGRDSLRNTTSGKTQQPTDPTPEEIALMAAAIRDERMAGV